MEINEKLDRIIDLLVAQNNLLTSMVLTLKQSGPANGPSVAYQNSVMPQLNSSIKGDSIKAEIERRIQDARREAQAKISQVQLAMPEMKDLLKTE